MIVEALKYAAARLAGQDDRHGHLAEAIAMQARHARQRAAWQPHLEQCRATCLDAALACPPERRRTALVVGAGLLLDVPLEELARRFQQVVLLDLAFLPGVAARAKALGNVRLLRHDITGCLDGLGGLGGRGEGTDESPLLAPPVTLGPGSAAHGSPSADWAGLDFVYSANLLSQLPLHALAALLRHAPHLDETARETFAASLIRAHLDWLGGLPCPACLVADVEEYAVEEHAVDVQAVPHKTGEETITPLLYGVEIRGSELRGAETARTWTWNMAPGGEALPGMDVRRRVLGILDARTRGPHAKATPMTEVHHDG